MSEAVNPPFLPVDPPSETRVLLTIDTELIRRPGDDLTHWEPAFERSYEAAGVGVRYQLRVLAQYALKACFFVDPMPACVYGLDPIRRMVDPILEAGQEVQLHLHPLWVVARDGDMDGERELARYNRNEQRDLIARARDLLIEAGVPEPIAFRAGNYSANDDTLSVLAELGFRFDSSHNGHQHPWPSAIGLPRDHIAPILHQGVIEVPLTVIAEGQGSRHLQICAVSLGELKAAIEHGGASGQPVVNIVTHSFELANRAGTAPNKVHVKRFEDLCAYLSKERRRFPTAFFTDLDDLPLGLDMPMLPKAGFRRVGRLIEQIWSNQVEERSS
ncbi:polysaccharide deacetylase family protein [Sphingomonas sp. Root710]|uniref:polysaccharide deacetylase family protein n=1 Tax=Sphingomonas sp. Root710 TaxID=1736594 RepID=UPI000A4695C6|nr:polysaccharide deacetylase family protein [Sphingomonas sp. Root710]